MPGISIWPSGTGKPPMIHNRQADRATCWTCQAEGAPDTVICTASSDAAMARTCGRRVAAQPVRDGKPPCTPCELRKPSWLMPVSSFVETDAPYLTPHPHRGLANETVPPALYRAGAG